MVHCQNLPDYTGYKALKIVKPINFGCKVNDLKYYIYSLFLNFIVSLKIADSFYKLKRIWCNAMEIIQVTVIVQSVLQLFERLTKTQLKVIN